MRLLDVLAFKYVSGAPGIVPEVQRCQPHDARPRQHEPLGRQLFEGLRSLIEQEPNRPD
jgi:hypothetical protein